MDKCKPLTNGNTDIDDSTVAGRCRFTVSKPELKARLVSAISVL